ncbi:ABC transporter permease [Nibrella saemangeumensis]|uniref:ABC transporter permease n=1 Tax=Nibrella saemangeumensis TaxID=1084526 RepID=A0ABP8NEA9_9BACT
MIKNLLLSFSLALQNVRSRLFHTLLSILGIVIGVAALVAILSMIDGMEKYAQEQITKTTTINSLLIQSDPYKVVNDVRLKKDTFAILDYTNFSRLKATLTRPAKTYLFVRQSTEIQLDAQRSRVGVMTHGAISPVSADLTMTYGRSLTPADVAQQHPVALINPKLAKQLVTGQPVEQAIGKSIPWKGHQLRVVGIMEDKDNKMATMVVPITLFPEPDLKAELPMAVIEASHVEDVPVLKTQIENWLKQNLSKHPSDLKVISNEQRVSQAAKGFLLFRVIMGLIVGISVLVGGIGVMNVLLISVTERTSEIGVRKAMGAKRRDILLQFLSESVTISTFGSFLGLVLGILGTLIIIPIVKALTNVPFQAAYTWNTLFIISIVAVLVGIIFGTYPALRASRLDPVEAIRRE